MQDPMHCQMGIVGCKMLSLRACFARDHRGAECEISLERWLVAHHERKHIRGVVLTAIDAIEFAPFFKADDPQCDARVGVKRSAYPLAKLARCRNAAGSTRILEGEA